MKTNGNPLKWKGINNNHYKSIEINRNHWKPIDLHWFSLDFKWFQLISIDSLHVALGNTMISSGKPILYWFLQGPHANLTKSIAFSSKKWSPNEPTRANLRYPSPCLICFTRPTSIRWALSYDNFKLHERPRPKTSQLWPCKQQFSTVRSQTRKWCK